MEYDFKNPQISIGDLNFVQTCPACPEQYDVLDKSGCIVGYVRLRFGRLTANSRSYQGRLIFSHKFEGDTEFKGNFSDEKERMFYLELIAEKIKQINQTES